MSARTSAHLQTPLGQSTVTNYKVETGTKEGGKKGSVPRGEMNFVGFLLPRSHRVCALVDTVVREKFLPSISRLFLRQYLDLD